MGLPTLEDLKNIFKPAEEAQEELKNQTSYMDNMEQNLLAALGEIYLTRIGIEQQLVALANKEANIIQREVEIMQNLQALTES